MELFNVISIFTCMDVLRYMFICHVEFLREYKYWKILQEKGWVEDGYAQRTGFNELAKSNDIVIMYPQVEDLVKTFDSLKANSYQIKHNLFYNPNGCWNFMGYLNDSDMYKFATKTGYQMRGVARMVEKVAGISMF